jgi:quinolinate synthase
MKKNTLDKVLEVLEKETNEIILPPDIIQKAAIPLERMLAVA